MTGPSSKVLLGNNLEWTEGLCVKRKSREKTSSLRITLTYGDVIKKLVSIAKWDINSVIGLFVQSNVSVSLISPIRIHKSMGTGFPGPLIKPTFFGLGNYHAVLLTDTREHSELSGLVLAYEPT